MTKKAKKVKRDRRAEAKAFDVAVGARIRDRRKAMDPVLKQKELGDQIGCSEAQVSRYESGKTTCEPYTLDQAAKALGCKPSDFIDGIKVGK